MTKLKFTLAFWLSPKLKTQMCAQNRAQHLKITKNIYSLFLCRLQIMLESNIFVSRVDSMRFRKNVLKSVQQALRERRESTLVQLRMKLWRPINKVAGWFYKVPV